MKERVPCTMSVKKLPLSGVLPGPTKLGGQYRVGKTMPFPQKKMIFWNGVFWCILSEHCFEWLSFSSRFSSLRSGAWRYFRTKISPGRTYDGTFCCYFAKNILIYLSVKEFWKSVGIWQTSRQKYSDSFFSGHAVELQMCSLHLDADICVW